METFSTRQLAAIASANKTVEWIFRVETPAGTVYYWSTGTVASSGNETVQVGAQEAPGVWTDNEWERAESFKIINFSGITLRRGKNEAGIHAPNDVSFTVVNAGNTLTAVDFIGGTVRIGLVIADATAKELCGSWRFRIKSASPYAQQIDMVGVDFLQEYLRGSYPNTRLISDIFPNVLGTVSDNLCVPEPYGTCYIPLRSVYAVDARYYLLGETTDTYTITAVRSPREVGTKIEWTSGSFTFTQSTKADAAAHDWRVFQPIIADSDNDGDVDASGLWMSGSKILDMPTKFSRSDTASVTDPAEIIRRVLRNMGLRDVDLNLASFATATATFASWSLAWNFAFWYKEPRTTTLARLLAMCHSCLIVGEQVSLQVLSKTSQMTITNAEVLKMQDVGRDTFLYSDALSEVASDSGYVAFAKSGESQDEFIKVIVPAKATTAVIDSEVITLPGVSDTQQVQKLGTLYHQRKLLKSADVSATVKGTCLALRPDDVITINYADYGGTYDVLIDEITINPDVSVGLACLKFAAALDDWGDLSPGAITIITEGAITTVYMPVIVGPDSVGATVPPNLMPGRLRVGSGTSYVLVDPSTPLRISVYAADTEVMRFGNLNGFLDYVTALYGIAVGSLTDYLKYDPTNGLRLSGAVAIGGSLTQGYTAPGDDNTTPGAGFKVEDGVLEAYGGDHSFGGTILSSDGNYLVAIGKQLTATGLTKRYPLNSDTSPDNFDPDGRINVYVWSTSTWVLRANVGYSDTFACAVLGSVTATNAIGARFQSTGGDGILGYSYATDHFGVIGACITGQGYGGKFAGDKGPLVLIPSSSASAPTHSALCGTLWVTVSGVLYINTDGMTTWAKVGAQ
jgi:hypothetical protein